MNLFEKYAPLAARNSISQFCPPRNFELAGKQFDFVIDTGKESGDIHLDLLDENRLTWSIRSGASSGEADRYEVRKADDYTYLLTYCVKEPRANHTFVIDKEQGLVTFLRCSVGENPYYPYLIESHWGFGYIQEEGKEHTDLRRHGFTDDVAGTGVRWVYGHTMSTTHVYHNSNWYRIQYVKQQAGTSSISGMMGSLPGSDEPADYVKIKEGMYIVSATEQNMEKILGAKMGFRSDTLLFLDNWNRMYSVGRGYGTMTREGHPDGEIFCMIGKYASQPDIDEHMFTDENPYLV